MVSKQEEYFLAIAQAGNISRAAQGLYLSQPALSNSLKRLEEDLGTQLFSRDTYPLQLTQAGELYYRYVREYQERERLLRQTLAQMEREPSGTGRIGLNFWRSSLVLPQVLPKFQRQYPQIQVEPAEGTHQELAALLDQGKLDVALFHRPNPYPQFSFQHLRYERILLTVHRGVPALAALPPSPSVLERAGRLSGHPLSAAAKGAESAGAGRLYLPNRGISAQNCPHHLQFSHRPLYGRGKRGRHLGL